MMLVVDVMGDDIYPHIPSRKVVPHRYFSMTLLSEIQALAASETSKNISNDIFIDLQDLTCAFVDGKMVLVQMIRPIKHAFTCYEIMQAIIQCLDTKEPVTLDENNKVYLIK